MALPATDSFTGNNADPLSANWTVIDGGFEVASNRISSTAAGGNAAFWDADVFGDDQYAQVIVYTSATFFAGPMVRAAATRGYLITVESATDIKIQRLDSDESYTQLGATITGLTIASGDLWKLEAEGTTLRAYQNGVLVGTRTDGTYSSGSGGIFSFNAGSNLDDWEGGNLAGGGGTSTTDGKILIRPSGFA